MANFLGMQTGRHKPDFRGPQEKGKPAHGMAHKQVGRGGGAGASIKVPGRGAVKNNAPKMGR